MVGILGLRKLTRLHGIGAWFSSPGLDLTVALQDRSYATQRWGSLDPMILQKQILQFFRTPSRMSATILQDELNGLVGQMSIAVRTPTELMQFGGSMLFITKQVLMTGLAADA